MNKKTIKKIFTMGLCSMMIHTTVYATADDILDSRGNVDPVYVDAVEEQIDILPDELTEELLQRGWHIYVTDEDIDDVYCHGKYGSVMGVTLIENKNIYIEDRDNAVQNATIHEIGHAIDYECAISRGGTIDKITDSEEYMNIYYTENESFQNTFTINFYYNAREMFAEGVWKYYTQPELLKTGCPNLYAYIESAIENIVA